MMMAILKMALEMPASFLLVFNERLRASVLFSELWQRMTHSIFGQSTLALHSL